MPTDNPPEAGAKLSVPMWSAGDLHRTAVRAIQKITESSHGDHAIAVKSGVDQLQQATLLTEDESQAIKALVDDLHVSHHRDPAALRESVQALHDRLLLAESASPVAVAIVSIARDSVTAEYPSPALMAVVAAADVSGAISGANVGARVGAGGGIPSAIVGAFVGGVVGGAISSAAANKA